MKIGFVGDIHAGSHVGLWPVVDIPGEDDEFIGCRYLMECWRHLIASWPELDLLVLMGDLIDGKQQKSSGCGVFDGDLGTQAEKAAEVLKPLAQKAKKIMRVWGTPYHESHDKILKIVDLTLGVALTKQVIDLEIDGQVLNVAHHPMGGGTLYRGTSLDREALWSQLAAHARSVPDARWIVRAHRHYYALQDGRQRTILAMPCWQLATAHAVKSSYWRFQPDLGAVLMVDDKSHYSGYRFIDYAYPNPTVEVTRWPAL